MKTVKVKEIQTSPVIWLSEREMLSAAVDIIMSKRIHNIVIENSDQSLSVLSVTDILNSVAQKAWTQTPISALPKKILKLIDGEKSTIVASMAMEESDEIFGVIDSDGVLTGVVSYQDITDATELSADELSSISLNAIVLRNSASTALHTAMLHEVLHDLNTSPTACLIVLKEGKPCGIITQRDIIRFLNTGKSLNASLEACMTAPLFSVTGDISVTMALHLMQKHHYRRIIVLDERGLLAGVVPQKAIVRILYNYTAKQKWDSYARLNEVLAKEVALRTQELQKHQAELEAQVKQRTKELVEANAQLAKAKQEADDANKAKSIFLANMSHEIRTPMNAVLGFLELLSQTALDTEQIHYAAKTHSAANSLLGLLTDILDVSKIEAGKFKIHAVPFKPQEVFSHSLGLFELEAQKKAILLSYEVDQNVPEYLLGDPERIQQIIINLISNAFKFTESGSIHIALCMHEIKANRCSVEFAITDTGMGIAKEKQHDLFDSFTQVDTSSTRKQGGSGLGLAICKHLVEAMGGSIEVESDAGEGSTFSFTLNLEIPEDRVWQVQHHHKQVAFKHLSALLVEDDDDNREVASKYLMQMGIVVDEATNGKEALEKIRLAPYDIVLMDIHMPVMNGFSCARAIREEGFTALPIIALSACATVEEHHNSIAAGMNVHLTKPFKPKDLQQILVHYFPHKVVEFPKNESEIAPCWVYELQPIPGIELDASLCNYWINKEFFLVKFEHFTHALVEASQRLHGLLQHNNFSQSSQLLHKLKGSTELYGARTLTACIQALENNLFEVDDALLGKLVDAFDAAVFEITNVQLNLR